MWEASGHFDCPGVEIYLWVMLVKPGEAKDHALFSESSDCQQNVFSVAMVGYEHVNNFVDASGFIRRSVDVVHWNQFRKLAGQEFGRSDEVSVDKVSCCASVHHGFHGCLFHGVCGFQMNG